MSSRQYVFGWLLVVAGILVPSDPVGVALALGAVVVFLHGLVQSAWKKEE